MNSKFFTPIIFIFILFNFSNLFAQSNYPLTVKPGAKWTMALDQGMGSTGFIEVLITCDTQRIGNQLYYEVTTNPQGNDNYGCGDGGYVREDTTKRQIFFIPKEDENQQELLIIDYTLEKGDTFFIQNGAGEKVVDTVRTVDFPQPDTRFIDFGFRVGIGFYEGFGSSGFAIVQRCNCICIPRISKYEVLDLDCGAVTNLEEKRLDQQIKIVPNPAGDIVRIEVNPSNLPIEYKINNLTGQRLQSGLLMTTFNEIDINSLPKGLLIINFIKGRDYLAKKIIHQ